MDNATPVTQADVELQERLLRHGILFPLEFKDKLRALVLEGMRNVPLAHMLEGGLMQGAVLRPDGQPYGFSWGFGEGDGPHSVYQSVSPTRIVTGIADGRYLAVLNVGEFNAAGNGAAAALSFNGEEPDDSNAIIVGNDTTCGGRPYLVTLSNNNVNTVELKIRVFGAWHASFEGAHVALFRIGS